MVEGIHFDQSVLDKPISAVQEITPPQPEYSIEVCDELPIPKDTIDLGYHAYLEADEGSKTKFVMLKKNGTYQGFTCLHIPDGDHVTPELRFRYTMPEARRQGVGQRLSDATFSWLKEAGYEAVDSGISYVLKIESDGTVAENYPGLGEGGFRTYKARTRTESATVKPYHDINFISIDNRGYVNFAFRTYLNRDEPQLLPKTGSELWQYLSDQKFIPEGHSPQDMLELARQKRGVVYCLKEHTMDTLQFLDWVKQEKS